MKCLAGGGGGESPGKDQGQAKEKEVPQVQNGLQSVFQCEKCSKTYKHRTSLNMHVKKAHAEKGPDTSSELLKNACTKKTQDNNPGKIDIPQNRHVKEMTSSRRPSNLPHLSNVIDKIQMKPIKMSEEEEQDLYSKETYETEEEEVNVVREDIMEEEANQQSPSTAATVSQSEKRKADSPSTPEVLVKKPLRLADGRPTREGSRRKEETRGGRPVKEVNSKGE